MRRVDQYCAVERPRPVLFMMVLAAAIIGAAVLIIGGPGDDQAAADVDADLRAAQQRSIDDYEAHRVAWRGRFHT